MALENVLKGVLLAGGRGTRLGRNSLVTNKHLVAVGKYPMIEYPLATLQKLGICDITIVTGADHAGSMMNYLTQTHPEIDFTYKVQKEAGGIAQALWLARNVVQGMPIAVILGDNVYDGEFLRQAHHFVEKKQGAMLFLKKVSDPERFGVADISEGKILSIEEKPERPKSHLAVTGLYFYDSTVFDKITRCKPSSRGELEITDVNNLYVAEGRAHYALIDGFWSDAGTHESRWECEEFMQRTGYDPQILKKQ